MAYNMGTRSDEELERLRQQAIQQQGQTQHGYTPNATVNNYQQQANIIQGQKPANYTSKYQAGIDQLFDKILNRGKFEYDMNADTLYKQAMDKYSQQAKMGMQDTMGQAQAMTGGYGNSYAQTAGQQVYDKTMQNVTDMLPAMEERAYSRWRGEGDDMTRNLAMSQGMEQDEYGRYRDAKGDWQFDYGSALDRYNSERGFDYGAYTDKKNSDFQREQFDYNKAQDAERFEYQKSQDAKDEAWKQLQWDTQQAAANSGSRSGGRTEKIVGLTEDQWNIASELYENESQEAVDKYFAGLEVSGTSKSALQNAALKMTEFLKPPVSNPTKDAWTNFKKNFGIGN